MKNNKVYLNGETLRIVTHYGKQEMEENIKVDEIIWIGAPASKPRSKKIFVVESKSKSLILIPKQYENYFELVTTIINGVKNNNGIIISSNFL